MNKKLITKEFKKLVLTKAKIKKGTQADNIKLGNMSSWGLLFGNIDWYIPELELSCKGTCGNCCRGCFDPENPSKSPCYVAKSYVMHTNRNEDGTVGDIVKNKCTVKRGHAYRTLAITLFRDDLFKSLNKQLNNARNKHEIVRINESGELTCYEDLEMWCKLAILHNETVFYLYTKNYKAVRKAIENGVIPKNLFINISIWHEFGIKEYKEFSHHKQIRAFVLVDDVWTREKYASKGIELTSMCGAYDENGRMNHDVTCALCKKCFRNDNKCVGCYEH